jgi:hypothetical protein
MKFAMWVHNEYTIIICIKYCFKFIE